MAANKDYKGRGQEYPLVSILRQSRSIYTYCDNPDHGIVRWYTHKTCIAWNSYECILGGHKMDRGQRFLWCSKCRKGRWMVCHDIYIITFTFIKYSYIIIYSYAKPVYVDGQIERQENLKIVENIDIVFV